jgi:hypothetical protein
MDKWSSGEVLDFSGCDDSGGKKIENFFLGLEPEGLYTGGERIDIWGGDRRKESRIGLSTFFLLRLVRVFPMVDRDFPNSSIGSVYFSLIVSKR